MPDYPYVRGRGWVEEQDFPQASDPAADEEWFENTEAAIHQGQDFEKSLTKEKLTAKDLVGDYVVEGFLPAMPASATLNLDTLAGVAYVSGLRTTGAIESRTYASSSDTYVDLLSSGAYTYTAVGSGAAAPALEANSIRLFVVVTDAAQITQVNDLRLLKAVVRGEVAIERERVFEVPGTLAVGARGLRYYPDFAGTVIGVRASVGVAPSGAAVVVDLNKNGASVYTTQANRPTIAAGTNTVAAALPDDASVATGDYFTIDVDAVGSTTAGSDLTVQLLMRES